MTRKLLPYEHDLIAALGITKDEYLEFLAVQQSYTDIKEGTVLDIRNDPNITAIVLTVIGILLQVAAVLLLPSPSLSGQRQNREQRFSPRFGFNSTQELGKYGDTIPLVYTDISTNPNGGVRVAGQLLWSAVRSYGSNQFLQMLMLLTGGPITSVNIAKSAFGQTPVTDLIVQNYWIYFKSKSVGPLGWFDELKNNGDNDPTRYGFINNNPYRIQPTNLNNRVDGFSHAYSPSTSNVFGIYSPIPINARTYLRASSGRKYSEPVGITLGGLPSWGDQGLQKIEQGTQIQVSFESTADPPTGTKIQDEVKLAAIDARRGFASAFDEGGIFKLGSARFRVDRIKGTSTDEGPYDVFLECIEPGYSPSIPYTVDTVINLREDILESAEYKIVQEVYEDLISLDDRDTSEFFGLLNPTNYFSTLPADQRFIVDSAADLLKSGQIYTLQYQIFGKTAPYFKFVRDLTSTEIAQLERLIELDTLINSKPDRFYFIKTLARYEEASYNTLSPCNIVDIALKTQVFRRISGRQRKYGTKGKTGYPESDNGIQLRLTMFIMRYRKSNGTWRTVPGIFAVRRAAEQDNFVYIKFNGGSTPEQWQFKLEPVIDPPTEVAKDPSLLNALGQLTYFYIQNAGTAEEITLESSGLSTQYIYFTGFSRTTTTTDFMPPLNTSPVLTNEWDLFSLDADTQMQASFDRGPEFNITAVSEQITETFTPALYNNLSLIGFNIFSGKGLQDMRSFTTFVTQGKPVRRLRTSGTDSNGNTWGSPSFLYYPDKPDGPTCFAPDIYLDTVLDKTDGIGNYAKVDGIDLKQLAITKRFCIANQLYMDTVIADRQSWREFWSSAAPYSLLEFARIGGRETLIPALPYNSLTGEIDRKIQVSALFNQGNILENTYKEEYLDYDSNVQDIVVTVIYRSLDTNGTFAINKSISVRRSDTNIPDAVVQTFDLSAFVTNESQAIKFAKLLCNTRRYVRTAIEFKTFPTTSPVAPGAYIYVDIGQNSWDGITTGIIGPGGKLNAPIDNTLQNGVRSFLLYTSGGAPYSVDALVTNNVASSLANREGYLYVLGTKLKSRRVFRVTAVEMDEEGEVTVRASIFPCTPDDLSLIADFDDNLFTITR